MRILSVEFYLKNLCKVAKGDLRIVLMRCI